MILRVVNDFRPSTGPCDLCGAAAKISTAGLKNYSDYSRFLVAPSGRHTTLEELTYAASRISNLHQFTSSAAP